MKDKDEATRFLKLSLEQSRSIGLKQGSAAAEKVLWRVERDIM